MGRLHALRITHSDNILSWLNACRFKGGYTLRNMALKSLVRVEAPPMDEVAAYQQAAGNRDDHMVRGLGVCRHAIKSYIAQPRPLNEALIAWPSPQQSLSQLAAALPVGALQHATNNLKSPLGLTPPRTRCLRSLLRCPRQPRGAPCLCPATRWW